MKEQTKFYRLIERSYSAIKARGLINENTNRYDFLAKMQEELSEAMREANKGDMDKYLKEVTDLATVCIMQIREYKLEFEEMFELTVLKNERRAERALNGKA